MHIRSTLNVRGTKEMLVRHLRMHFSTAAYKQMPCAIKRLSSLFSGTNAYNMFSCTRYACMTDVLLSGQRLLYSQAGRLIPRLLLCCFASTTQQAANAKSLGRLRVLRVSNAFKRPVVQPPVVTPEEKTLQSMVETGIR
jgi:hypothetical protein